MSGDARAMTERQLILLASAAVLYSDVTGCTLEEAKEVASGWLRSEHPMLAAFEALEAA